MIIGLHLKPRGTGKVPKIKLSGDVFVCKRIGFAPFYDLIFDFGIVPTEWYFLFVILLDKILQNLEF